MVTVEQDALHVRFWGVRGGIPCPGETAARYGGNTACVEVRCGRHLLIFDTGTGIRALGRELDQDRAIAGDIFFSHTRFDHICGLPFFTAGFNPNNDFKIWAGHLAPEGSIRQALSDLMIAPLFPISLDYLAAAKDFEDFTAGDTLRPRPGVVMRTARLNHPAGATGYRVEFNGKAVCYVSNTAHVPGRRDAAVVDLIRQADILIYDSMYTDEEFQAHSDRGHSTWQEGVRLCEAAEVKTLAAFHHHPDHDDGFLDRVHAALDKARPGSTVAREGTVLTP